jgi:hypothetical protein
MTRKFTAYPSRYIKANTEYEPGGETFDGYMGATGWKGKNLDFSRDIKDIAKIIRSQFKKKFPGYKISARISRFSGGQALDVTVWMHTSDLMSKEDFIQQSMADPYRLASNSGMIGYVDSNGRYQWVDAYTLFNNMGEDEMYQFFADQYDADIAKYSGGDASYPTIHYTSAESALIPLVNSDPLDYLRGLIDSFNYDNSNGMVDYFDVNFYDHLEYKYD